MIIYDCLGLPFATAKEVKSGMEFLASLILSVLSKSVGHLFCKLIDVVINRVGSKKK